MTEVYYFGCVKRVGHFFHDAHLRRTLTNPSPWPRIDGALTPGARDRNGRRTGPGGIQGHTALHHLDGWTALAVHDFTVDSRPGSNSVFLFHAVLDLARAVEVATEHFPAVVARIGPIIAEQGAPIRR